MGFVLVQSSTRCSQYRSQVDNTVYQQRLLPLFTYLLIDKLHIALSPQNCETLTYAVQLRLSPRYSKLVATPPSSPTPAVQANLLCLTQTFEQT
jgi:hypothetical protein